MHRKSQQKIEQEKQQRRAAKSDLHGEDSFGQPAYQRQDLFAPETRRPSREKWLFRKFGAASPGTGKANLDYKKCFNLARRHLPRAIRNPSCPIRRHSFRIASNEPETSLYSTCAHGRFHVVLSAANHLRRGIQPTRQWGGISQRNFRRAQPSNADCADKRTDSVPDQNRRAYSPPLASDRFSAAPRLMKAYEERLPLLGSRALEQLRERGAERASTAWHNYRICGNTISRGD